MAKKQLRPDKWYITEDKVFTKYRNLKKYVSEQNDIPIEDLLDVSLAELNQYAEIKRIKVKLNRKGVPIRVIGDENFDLTRLTPEDA